MYVFFYPALSHQFKTKARGHVDPHPSPLDTEASGEIMENLRPYDLRDYENPLLSLNKAEN